MHHLWRVGGTLSFNPPTSRVPILWGYILAVLSIGLAALASVRLAAMLGGSPLPLLLLAVVLSAWIGGPGPGILAAFLGTLAFDYLLSVPSIATRFGPVGFPLRLLVYLSVALVVVLLSNAQRAALAATDSERRRLEQILDVLPQSVLLLGPRGGCTHANAAAQHLFGANPAASGDTPDGQRALATTYFRRADGNPLDHGELPFSRAAFVGAAVENQQLVVHHAKNGEDIPVLASSAPFYDRRHALTGAVVILQDIRAIKEFDQQKEEFLVAVAHDLRNPLSNIRGFTQLLLRETNRPRLVDDRPSRRALESIERAADRLAEMINELVDVGRLQMNRQVELELGLVDLVALTRAVVEDQKASVMRPVEVRTALTRLHGEWDGARLRRVLDNLLNNAVKYSPDGAPIVVSVARRRDAQGDWAIVTVEDQGIGIPTTDLPHVFERFHRAGNVRGRVAGTGIGLAGARQLVVQHGGGLTVTSEEGKGSVFTLSLPVSVPESDRDDVDYGAPVP